MKKAPVYGGLGLFAVGGRLGAFHFRVDEVADELGGKDAAAFGFDRKPFVLVRLEFD